MRGLPQGSTRSFVADFFPGYFGLVMATGIVSIALRSAEWYLFSNLLFGINVVSFCVLWGITILRLTRYRVAFVRDLTHHARGVTFLTMVAATSVLGVQFAQGDWNHDVGHCSEDHRLWPLLSCGYLLSSACYARFSSSLRNLRSALSR